jgi:hypothetical protein
MLSQEGKLTLAADHRRVEPPWPLGGLTHRDEAECRDPLRLALQLERLDLFDLDVVSNEPVGHRAQQDLLGACSLLQPRGHVHRVPGDETLSGDRVARDHHAGVHAGPDGEPHAPVALELVVEAA